MSWFASLGLAQLAGPAPPAQEDLPASTSRSSASLPVERAAGNKPRAKAPANKARLLPRWEAPSDDEHSDKDFAEINMDNQSDLGELPPARRGNSSEDQSPVIAEARDFEMGLNENEPSAAAMHSMAPLKSYEETVLKLRYPGVHKKQGMAAALSNGGDGDGDDDGDDDEEMTPMDAAEAQKKLQHELKMREKLLEEEKLAKEQDLQRSSLDGVNALQASRVIVGVAKVKLNMMRQKMKLYEEAESHGTAASLRSRKLLMWIASLSVLKKFEDKMAAPGIMQAKTEVYLMNLEPPPPPPPPEDPPDSEDEELHEKYEAMIRKYETSWTKEGQRVLGKDKFSDIRNMPRNGPAEREKKLIAQKCLQQAGGVLNESEYQELLRKAWRLGDDHAALAEYNPQEFARRVANSSSSNEKAGNGTAKKS